MLQASRGSWRKALCCLIAAAMMGYGWVSSVRAGTTTVTLMPGSVRATVNGQGKTMLVRPVVDGTSQQILVPIGFLGRQFGYAVSVLEHNSGL
ncbi:MAG TPA: stalk domain-containing protein, partial [Candidatus Cryosericum sp.]